MDMPSWIVLAFLAEVLFALALIATIFAHALWFRRSRTKSEGRIKNAREILVSALDKRSLSKEQYQRISSLPVNDQAELLTSLIINLEGAQKEWLTGLAGMNGLLATAEGLCHSRWWWRRLKGIRLLTALGGGGAVVPPLLSDRNPTVRAQAAEWATNHPTEPVINALLNLLADPGGLCCFAAQDSLLRIGGPIVEPMTTFLSNRSGVEVEAALMVAITIPSASFLLAALALSQDADPEVRSLVATLLGNLGGEEGANALVTLLSDKSDKVRASAATGLGKLKHLGAAPLLSRLMEDEAWDVRQAAGITLKNLGAPGILFLRRAQSAESSTASDMAHQVLDLPTAA